MVRLPALLALTAALLGAGHALKLVPVPALPPAPDLTLPGLPVLLPDPVPGTVPPTLTPAPSPLPSLPRPSTQIAPIQTPAGLPTDPLFPQQWALQQINMPAAWSLFRGGPVTVAVLDTGFVNSPELVGRVVNGYDFVRDVNRAGDGDGRDRDATATGPFQYHGEAVANIIAAAHDASGMAGINPLARIVHVRVAGVDGMIEVQDLVDGLKWAAGLSVPGVPVNPNPARIVNLSLYADFIPLTRCDARVQAALDAVTARGVLVVAGAANDDKDASGYSPAGCRNVLTVTSVGRGGQRPAYANWGRSVALAAPGGDNQAGVVVSSLSEPSGERRPTGTSLAAPHVTGVASLILAARPAFTPAQVRDLLVRNTMPFPGGPCDPDPLKTCGSGILNAQAALVKALAAPASR